MQKKRMTRIKEIVNEMTVEECFEKFMAHCTAKNLSNKTIKFYKEVYGHFTEVVDSNENINSVCIEEIEEFIVQQRARGLSTNSINTRVRGVRVFLYFCMERNYLENEFKIHLLKAEEVIKECYTDKELKKILRQPHLNDWVSWRNWAIVNFLLGTGARVSTVIAVKIGDVRFDTNKIIFKKTKNRKQQIIPLSNQLKKVLMKYLATWEHNADDYLFPSQDGKQLTDNGFIQAVRDHNLSRGVTKTSSHLFRHTFATNYIKSNGNLFKLQKLLGHSSIDIVKKYVNLLDADLQDDFENCCILDRLQS